MAAPVNTFHSGCRQYVRNGDGGDDYIPDHLKRHDSELLKIVGGSTLMVCWR